MTFPLVFVLNHSTMATEVGFLLTLPLHRETTGIQQHMLPFYLSALNDSVGLLVRILLLEANLCGRQENCSVPLPPKYLHWNLVCFYPNSHSPISFLFSIAGREGIIMFCFLLLHYSHDKVCIEDIFTPCK